MRLLKYYFLVTSLVIGLSSPVSAQCNSVFDRLRTHTVASGETIEAIAARYNLLPRTLISFNPSLQSGQPTPGTPLRIPPFNGITVSGTGTNWQALARRYGVRADVLFEANGCQDQPGTVIFIPGVSFTPGQPAQFQSFITAYPLPQPAAALLEYGFNGSQFHSGLDLAVPLGTQVLAAGDGVVAFVGEQGELGQIIVINHAGGQQSRYAHLGSIGVSMQQQVRAGQPIGTVGNTGRPHNPNPHLHFEIRINSPAGALAQDPQLYLEPLLRGN